MEENLLARSAAIAIAGLTTARTAYPGGCCRSNEQQSASRHTRLNLTTFYRPSLSFSVRPLFYFTATACAAAPSRVPLSCSSYLSFSFISANCSSAVFSYLLRPKLWLRIGWIGIAMVPAAQFHLSSELLASTGKLPNWRRFLVPGAYIAGATIRRPGALYRTTWLVKRSTRLKACAFLRACSSRSSPFIFGSYRPAASTMSGAHASAA